MTTVEAPGALRREKRAEPSSSTGPDPALLDKLAHIVGQSHVLTGTDVSQRATHFWNPAPLEAGALVRPANTSELSQVMKACHAASQSVVTHGGVTGLVEGDRSEHHDVIVSLERMREIETVDVTGRTITVQAGAVLQRVQEAASESGLQFGLDLGARGSCTIGGNISTNAGGLSVLRYGMMREQVLGLEAVLADGTIVSSMNRMMKNNAGYDLKQLFVGSEGTLGIVTRAVLRLRPATPTRQTALVAFETFEQVTGLLSHLGNALNGTLDSFEVLWQRFYRLNTDPQTEGNISSPLSRDYPLYAIVESRGNQKGVGPESDEARFHTAMESALEQSLIVDAAVAQSERERSEIWKIRETIEIALRHDPVFVYDISLPIVAMKTYLNKVESALRGEFPTLHFYAYGHLADGNLHLMVAPAAIVEPGGGQGSSGKNTDAASEQKLAHHISDRIVYSALAALGGSISAEHGIGLAKKAWLSVSRNDAETTLMRTLKNALDAKGILNPGKII